MSRTVSFWFEFASTYSYPAAMTVEAEAKARGVTLVWRPFLLGPVFASHGLETSPFILNPVKGAYMWRDLERLCAARGLPFRKPSVFPRGSLLAARIACRFADAPWIGDFIRDVYTANFARDADIGAPETVVALLERAGQSPEEILAEAQTQQAKDGLRRQTEDAIDLGIFGAPTFEVDGELFWGNERMAMAFDRAQGARPSG